MNANMNNEEKQKYQKYNRCDGCDGYCHVKCFIRKYHSELGLVLLIILIIVGMYVRPQYGENGSKSEHGIQIGGRFGNNYDNNDNNDGPPPPSLFKSKDQKTNNEKKEETIGDIQKKFQAQMASKSTWSKSKMLGKDLTKSAYRGMRDTPDVMMDKFREGSSLIYTILYQIAFVIVILLIIFPSVGMFIIGIVCFGLLKNKINYLKTL